MAISDAQALAAMRTLALYLGIGSSTSGESFDQDRLPPGERTKDHYFRRHRERVLARVPGWSKIGQRRIVTAEAWATELETETNRSRITTTRKLVAVPAPRDIDADLDRQLGIKTRAAR